MYIYPASLFNDESGFGSSNNDIIDNNKILTLIWKWDPESIRYDIFDDDSRIKPKAIQLKKLQEELHAIGNSHLTFQLFFIINIRINGS